jgi:hypothetical protein
MEPVLKAPFLIFVTVESRWRVSGHLDSGRVFRYPTGKEPGAIRLPFPSFQAISVKVYSDLGGLFCFGST